MTIDDIIKYVCNTPENTNPSVLRGMLEELVANSSEEETEALMA